MTSSEDSDTRRIAEDGTQENPEGPVDGGRSSYGPGNTGGEQQPGGLVPPYEGRQESARPVQDRPTEHEGARFGGNTGPVTDDRMKAPDPAQTPGGRTASPADEQPASESGGDAPDEGSSDTGSHVSGTPRGEDAGGERGREHLGQKGESERPHGTSTARDMSGVNPQDPVTAPSERAKG
jgi:hypothetical protein